MRRGVRNVRNVLGAGVAVLCLGGLLSACGDGGGDGYVATGAAPERRQAVGPTGDVKLVPLDEADGVSAARGGGGSSSSAGPRGEGGSEGKSPAAAGSSTRGTTPGGHTEGDSGTPSAPGPGGHGTDAPGSQKPDPGPKPGPGPDPKPDPKPDPRPDPPSGPAALSVGDPDRKPADKRWCENVTVAFRNTGGSPVRSGTVTFGTHIIGALGVDWATIESTVKLPAPIGAGQKKEKTWPVCVDAWRVPLGMHVETRDVAVQWR
ncbi:hypothetical protein AB0933_22845 [Streptomyces venezuelae]|uniref:hypothetical protein n=1 Tax=Streptomyces venezuelae TaxID=54571 RepID=UPI00345615D3